MTSVTNPVSKALAVVTAAEDGDAALVRIRPYSRHLAELSTTASGKQALRAAFGELDRLGASVLAVPRSLAEPAELLGEALVAAGKYLDAEHPGAAMVIVEESRAHREYRRGLAVVDAESKDTSGLAALFTVGLAARTGAAVDILLLGVPPDVDLSTRELRLQQIPIRRSTELFQRAIDIHDHAGLELGWIAAGEVDDPVQDVLRRLGEADYDFVSCDLGGVRLPRKLGRKRSVRMLLDDPKVGAMGRRLLEEAPCDVITMIDAVELGIISSEKARVAAVATVAASTMGIGVAIPVSSAAGQSTVAVATAEAGAAHHWPAKTQKAKKAKKDGKANKAQKSGKAGKSGKAASAPSLEESLKRLDDAERKQRRADRRASQARADKQEARQELKQAEAKQREAERDLKRLQRASTPEAAELADARLALGEAKQEAALQRQALAEAEARASGVAALVPGAPSAEEISEIEAGVAAADQDVDAADEAAAQAYLEYAKFAEEVERAERQLQRADDRRADNRAEVKAVAERQAKAQERSRAAEREVKQISKSLADHGIAAPATGRVTSPFGMRVHPVTGSYKLHTGTDFEGNDGNYYAAASGTVKYAGYDGAYGNMVKISHGTINGHRVETWYAHQPGLQVSVGDHVDAGDKIGNIDSTGYTTGPHAHVELRIDGEPVDITDYL